jgi:hypothetical protein
VKRPAGGPGLLPLRGHRADDRRRVEPAGQEHTHRHVAAHPDFDGILKQRAEFADRIFQINRLECAERPEPPDSFGAGRRQFGDGAAVDALDTLEERLVIDVEVAAEEEPRGHFPVGRALIQA